MDVGTVLAVVAAPLLLSTLNAFHARRKEKRDEEAALEKEERDYKRQDEVAARLLAQNEATAARLVDQNARVAKTAEETLSTTRVIHTLVNSDMTIVLEGQLCQTRLALAGMREMIEFRRALGQEPSRAALEELAAQEESAREQMEALDDRARQTQIASDQAAESAEAAANPESLA